MSVDVVWSRKVEVAVAAEEKLVCWVRGISLVSPPPGHVM